MEILYVERLLTIYLANKGLFFGLRFSGIKIFINLQRQFWVRKIFSRRQLRTHVFAGFAVFSFILCLKLLFWKFETSRLLFNQNLRFNNRLLISVYIPVNRIVFNRFEWFNSIVDELKETKCIKETKVLKSLQVKAEAYLTPKRVSMMKLFCENN